jgi:hypothetical protein
MPSQFESDLASVNVYEGMAEYPYHLHHSHKRAPQNYPASVAGVAAVAVVEVVAALAVERRPVVAVVEAETPAATGVVEVFAVAQIVAPALLASVAPGSARNQWR